MLGLGGALGALPALQLPAALSFPTLPHLSLMLMQPLSPLLQPLPSVAPMLLCVELPVPGGGLGGAGARLAAAAAALACVALASSALLSSELVVVSFLRGRTHG